MPLLTTVVGSMVKPDYLPIPSAIEKGHEVDNFIESYNNTMANCDKKALTDLVTKATKEIIAFQEKIGIDVITDGELRREAYYFLFCRGLNGFNFEKPVITWCRNKAWKGLMPRIVGKIGFKTERICSSEDWAMAHNLSRLPVKFTIPGPMTIFDTMVNEYYKDEDEFFEDFIRVVNIEIKEVAKAGCKFIQIDEPVLVRNPELALEKGIRNLKRCFDGLPNDVSKIIHCCCGYPQYLDQTDYQKADKDAYLKIAEELDDAGFDAISIEDSHRRNDPELFKKFKKTKIILGVVDVVKSRIESVEEIKEHISDVLKYIPPERLEVAPDCGLVFLTRDMAEKKLTNLVQAARCF